MTDDNRHQALEFEDEKRAGLSGWVAFAFVLALGAWMGSGYYMPTEEKAVEQTQERRLATVATRDSRAEIVTQFFVAEGQALPDRETIIRAETSGEIAEVNLRKGASVVDGDLIASIDVADRTAQLEQAQAELDRTTRELTNARELLERGVATQDRVTAAESAQAAAQAGLASVEQGLDDTVIRAPFDGVLDDIMVDAGEFVQAGGEVARIIDTDPLTIEVQVPQQAVRGIRAGQMASVAFITGEERQGEVTYVSGSADAETRTFQAEIVVDNPDGDIPAGVSAQIRVPVAETEAHFISPAVLSLGTDGTLGVKTVDAEATVVFTPVDIVRAQTDGIWVSGLAPEARIITIGQGFVSAGERVDPRDEAEASEEEQREAEAVASELPDLPTGEATR
ncbi:efflux RND transporter periplasmic adaptor subunit [Roseobacter sp. HKCCA0434]|uniref:efflux RND transporter periplasmic adaptor subunit n=1 Tax=Roseobacter sp. HKCCA0434 TaxID=3079297 RepID=UPI002905DCB7|nr:efflux RND transporter periplasmic adaptor subunit [Roseobacter sp. HKCCA0434]